MKGKNEKGSHGSRLPCLIELCKMRQQRLNQTQRTIGKQTSQRVS